MQTCFLFFFQEGKNTKNLISPVFISLKRKKQQNKKQQPRRQKTFAGNIGSGQNSTNNNSFNFDVYSILKPQHKIFTPQTSSFLEWFIGFSEGDGSFFLKENKPIFVINQADLVLLNSIRTELGFGFVYTFNQSNRTYARYCVQDEKGVEMLISIFNGNIHLEKVQTRFENWLNQYNKVYNKSIALKPRRNPSQISLDNAWISGFFDAEGGLSASISTSENMLLGIRLRLKAYVDQQYELPVMQKIANCFNLNQVTVRDKKNQYYRADMSTKKTLISVQKYLNTYKLRSKKKYVFTIWNRLVDLFGSGQHLSQSRDFLERRVKKLQELNAYFKTTETVCRSLDEDISKGIINIPD